MRLMGIPFTHRAVSVFRHLAEFQSINPVVKAPTLILDDGSTLMDSTLILDYLDTLHPERSLMPRPCLNVSTVCTCWDWRLLPWKKACSWFTSNNYAPRINGICPGRNVSQAN
jgi:hypothetical protein